MASMLKSKKFEAIDKLCHLGCSCCNSKQNRRTAKKNAKRKEDRAWRKNERNAW
jgi:hypothetical protein